MEGNGRLVRGMKIWWGSLLDKGGRGGLSGGGRMDTFLATEARLTPSRENPGQWHIQNPVKHLRRRFFQKQLKVENSILDV